MSKTNVQTFSFSIKRFQDHLQGKEGQILLGAFKSIVEIGIAATTIRGIAKRAAVNPGIIHYYFKSKEELLSRVLELCYQNAINNIEALFDAELSPVKKIESLIDLGLSILKRRRDEWIVMTSFWAYCMAGHGDMLKVHQKLNRRFQAVMIKLLKKTMDKSGSKIIKDTALLLISAMEGLSLQYVLDPQGFDPEGVVNLLRKLILTDLLPAYADQ